MSKLRISVVQYLNTAPLIRGFTHGPLRAGAAAKYELSFTVPSQCAEALRTGAADLAILPAIEYPRIVSQGTALTIVPGLAIASKERVRSLLVISKVPIRAARRIALDPSSRSTQALIKILAAKHWQISPEFAEGEALGQNGDDAKVGLAAMLKNADAALIIGDPALRILLELRPSERLAIGLEDLAQAPGNGELVSDGQKWGVPDAEKLYFYDVVEEWRRMTGLPAVLAVWAGRKEVITSDVVADFLASRDFGLTQIPQIAAEAAREMGLPEKELQRYLEENIDYTLDAENMRGLERFFEESEALKLIGPAHRISMADSATAVRFP